MSETLSKNFQAIITELLDLDYQDEISGLRDESLDIYVSAIEIINALDNLRLEKPHKLLARIAQVYTGLTKKPLDNKQDFNKVIDLVFCYKWYMDKKLVDRLDHLFISVLETYVK